MKKDIDFEKQVNQLLFDFPDMPRKEAEEIVQEYG